MLTVSVKGTRFTYAVTSADARRGRNSNEIQRNLPLLHGHSRDGKREFNPKGEADKNSTSQCGMYLNVICFKLHQNNLKLMPP